MSELKIDNVNGVNAVNASANAPKINAKAEDTSKDTQKPTEKKAESKAVKHVVVYVGSSEFKDSTGYKWHKNDEKTYDDEEYKTRSDLHFMVKYGEMKHTAVTM